MKTFAMLGSLFGMLAVVTGAFGAHALANKVDARMLEIWETAAHYQIVHALALFAAAWLVSQTQSTVAIAAGWCFTAGILVFSGSLYLMVFTGARWLGAITPIGGTAMIVGWFCCMLAALKLGS
ncbi:DUF423 domain-containing protein [Lujinxingia litoralis]|uniref:DUF423 domain-containing protein n=1 Tax=Lujinxingia litoralis TaxID=2211119 RepID=A0A328C433_9DELT|nr:DUF423 domain-containing protein [Lujinxingia litoralis]RAL21154.1 DUF423 domain-containing protein [Lujinxingia litoralis]